MLLDVGHGESATRLVRSGDRALSQDNRRWVLWDVPSGRQIANGSFTNSYTSPSGVRRAPDGPRLVDADLVGDTLITPGTLRFDVRSARDGRVLATIPIDDRMVTVSGIARDASYVYVATDQVLRLYDLTGRVLNVHPGNYAKREPISAEPNELRRVDAAAGTLEILTPKGELRTSPPFEGTFQSWFLDGSHFITRRDTELRIHRADGTLARTLTVAPSEFRSAGGDGRFVWSYAGRRQVQVYDLTSEAPVLQFEGTPRLVGRTARAVFDLGAGRFRVLDLTGGAPSSLDRTMPAWNWSLYSVDDEGQWAVSADRGELFVGAPAAEEAPTRLGCGAIEGFASAENALAVATRDDVIRFYDLTGGRRTLTHSISQTPVSDLSYADHGRYLVLRSRVTRVGDDDSIRVLEAATGKQVYAWRPDSSASGRSFHQGLATSSHADVVARQVCETVSLGKVECTLRVAKVDGTELFSTPPFVARSAYAGAASLSPDGRHFAYPHDRAEATVEVGNHDVEIYEDGQHIASIAQARSVLWLDDARMLVTHIQLSANGTELHLADAKGATLRILPPKSDVAVMRGYSPDYFSAGTSVFRLADGARVWDYRDSLGPSYSIANPHTVITGKTVGLAGSHRVMLATLP